MSFRTRITVVLAAIVAAATAAVALAALQVTRSQIYDELDRALARVARVGTPDGPPAAPPRLRGLPRQDDTVAAQVHLPDGSVQVVGATDELTVPARTLDRARDGTPQQFSSGLDGVPFRGLARPLGDDTVLVVAADASEQARVLRALLGRLLLIGGLVAAAAALVGWFVAGRLVAPLARLTAAAEHVTSTGDLSVSVRTDDPDEAGRLSRSFDGMLAALAASQDQQQRLVDDAGHELRTPIASILSNAEVLKRYPELDPETRNRIADDVIAESRELTRLVNAVVDLAGVAGSAEEPTTVDVADLVTAAARRLPASDRDRVVVRGNATATLRVTQVSRAVVNLLTNAVKFDPSGQPVDVTITSSTATGAVDIAVRDHGPGIAHADLPHVFARFYRADSARGTPGSGLGLAIVSDVAHRNGGTVSASTHADGGAVVRLTLPTQPEPADQRTGSVA